MKIKIIILLLSSLCYSGSTKSENSKSERSIKGIECTLETINEEIGKLSGEKLILDSLFHLSEQEIIEYLDNSSVKKEVRETIMLKFMSRLNDDGVIKTLCSPTELLTLKIGDLAFYCLAYIEKFPFALATHRQNCTERNISTEILIPTNFIYYTQFERERLTFNFLQYYQSKERQEFITKEGYD